MGFDLNQVGKNSEPFEFAYTWKDVVTYALGVGTQMGTGTASTQDELDFVLELRGPKVLPTFAVIPSFVVNVTMLSNFGGNLLNVLHGGQKIVVHREIPPQGKLKTVGTISACYDKGKGALVLVDTETTDEKGQKLFDNQWQIFYRGEGGFGGGRGPEARSLEPPARAADWRFEQATYEWQPLLYRLTGDLNPIHADPEIAKMVGFPRPIMHGLCTLGFAGRALLRHACGGDPKKFRAMETRFTKPVFPGETLIVEGWQESQGSDVRLRVSTKERGEPVMVAAAEVA